MTLVVASALMESAQCEGRDWLDGPGRQPSLKRHTLAFSRPPVSPSRLLLVYVGSFPVSRLCILLLSIQFIDAAGSLDQAARGGDVPSPPFLPHPFCLGLQMCALSLSWLGTSLLSSSVRLLWCLPHSCFWWSCLAWRMAGLVWLPLAGLFAFFLPLPLPL